MAFTKSVTKKVTGKHFIDQMLKRTKTSQRLFAHLRTSRSFHPFLIQLQQEKNLDVPESWKKIAQKELGKEPIEKLFRKTPEVIISTFSPEYSGGRI